MNTPEPPQMDPDRVIRGAATEVVLQLPGMPEVQFDRRTPQLYRPAVEAHFRDQVQPRVNEWMDRNLTREVEDAMFDIIGRYNFVLARHAGERMVNMDFYPGRPPMDPYEAAHHDVPLDDDVAREVTFCDWAAVADVGGVSGSLDAVRAVYVRALRGIRDELARAFQPVGREWMTPEAGIWRRIGQTQLLLAPFVHRHAEEFVALHVVQGRVTDMATHHAGALPEPDERGTRLLRVADLEHRQLQHSLETLQFRANRILDEYRSHKAEESGRTGLGKLLFPSSFPADRCRQLAKFVRTDLCIGNAKEHARRVLAHWMTAFRLGAAPHDSVVIASFDDIWRSLQDFRTLLNGLSTDIFDGYEGK